MTVPYRNLKFADREVVLALAHQRVGQRERRLRLALGGQHLGQPAQPHARSLHEPGEDLGRGLHARRGRVLGQSDARGHVD